MMKIPLFVNKLLRKNVPVYDKYAYFKLAYSRGANQLQILREIMAATPELIILFGITKFDFTQQIMEKVPTWLWALLLAMFLFIEKFMTFYVGHIDLQNRLMDRDISLSNKYNPEIQKLLKGGKIE